MDTFLSFRNLARILYLFHRLFFVFDWKLLFSDLFRSFLLGAQSTTLQELPTEQLHDDVFQAF